MRTLFKGGTIYDGTGRRPFTGDVLIEDDRIVKIDKNIKEKADETIDISAEDKILTLSTCNSYTEDGRMFVVAKRVK